MHGHPHPAPWDKTLEGIDPGPLRVFHAFKKTMMLERHLMHRTMSAQGTYPAQAGCMRLLAAEDGVSQRDLAERLHVSAPTVTTMLQKMEKAGLIERRSDEADHRLTRIYLTEAGRELNARVFSAFKSVIEVSIGGMAQDDIEELTRLLEVLSDNIARALGDVGCEGEAPTC